MINIFPKAFSSVVYIFLIASICLGCKKKETDAIVEITTFSFDNTKLYQQGDSIYFELKGESNVNVEDVVVSLMVKRNSNYIQVVAKNFVQKIRFPSASGYLVIPDLEGYDVADFILRAYIGVGDVRATSEVPVLMRLSNNPLYSAFRKDGALWRCYDLLGDSLALNIPSTHENTNWLVVNERRHVVVIYNENSQVYEQWDLLSGTQLPDLVGNVESGLIQLNYGLAYDTYFSLFNSHWTSVEHDGNGVVKSADFIGGVTPYALAANGGRVAVCMNSNNALQRGIYLFNYQGQNIGFVQDDATSIHCFTVGNELYAIANRPNETVFYPLTVSGKGEEINLGKGNVTGVYVDRISKSAAVSTSTGLYELNVANGGLSIIRTATNVVSFVAVKSDDLVVYTNPEGVFAGGFNLLNGTSKLTLPPCEKVTYSL